ncbi:peptidylprolyl isomerase [Bacillus infantis]|uniref:Peptidyl-prolyl cis-trans isomerase n=1 Tax=Bacillus infantis TaxID=324767 RepID=A0A5D4S5B8_9BACI|nr:peptidylprolyl isomerase [Bacillus infantis]TYS58857.1 peptidylprolyl isomerase [Bacillus infantis]
MKKNFIYLFLAAVMMLLAACGTSTDQNSGAGKEGGGASEGTQGEQTDQAAEEKSAEGGYPQLTAEVGENERLVEMETSMGTIKIKLFPDHAPKAVENFITHSEEGYYDGLIFHRVINDFMIQGGDPDGTGMGGESIYGQPFEDEFSDKLYNLRGALSMANSGANTNGSQFFIVQKSTSEAGMKEQMEKAGYPEEIVAAYDKGGTPWLDSRHTVFGQVIEGMEIVDDIAAAETDESDRPVDDIKIKEIKVIK